MKARIICILLGLCLLTGCNQTQQREIPTQSTPPEEINVSNEVLKTIELIQESFEQEQIFDVRYYYNRFGYNYPDNYFDFGVNNPTLFEYTPKENQTIEEVAYTLGEMLMNNLMQDYEGKTFVVTEYRNLKPTMYSEQMVQEWEKSPHISGNNIKIAENQWICGFAVEYKYTGIYSLLGEMPSSIEWMTGLETDGSGEYYHFIIQKEGETYYMRSMLRSQLTGELTPYKSIAFTQNTPQFNLGFTRIELSTSAVKDENFDFVWEDGQSYALTACSIKGNYELISKEYFQMTDFDLSCFRKDNETPEGELCIILNVKSGTEYKILEFSFDYDNQQFVERELYAIGNISFHTFVK